jgi:hypothetical protein
VGAQVETGQVPWGGGVELDWQVMLPPSFGWRQSDDERQVPPGATLGAKTRPQGPLSGAPSVCSNEQSVVGTPWSDWRQAVAAEALKVSPGSWPHVEFSSALRNVSQLAAGSK